MRLGLAVALSGVLVLTGCSGSSNPSPAPASQSPVANAGGPNTGYTGTAGAAVSFSGAGSSDPQSETLTYAWNFGDSTTGTGVSPTHTFAAAGAYTITLTVTNTTNLTGTATGKATIAPAPRPPVGNAGGPYTGTAGTAMGLNGSGSSDPQSETLTYAWNFGDSTTGTGVSPIHTYATAGTFPVTLTVTDTSNLTGTAASTATITAVNLITFIYSGGEVTMSTALQGGSIFYTLDGSTATEASIEYINPVTVAPGVTINAVAVQMSGVNPGVAVQNGQVTPGNFKTVLACTDTVGQCEPYTSPVNFYNTPAIDWGSGASGGSDGVQGIPTQIGMVAGQSLPSVTGSGTTTNFNMTTQNLSGAGSGLQVLWPYNVGGGCDSCTSMIEDFYIWPQYTSSINPANVENWELDMNSWKLGDTYGYLGASFQCSILDGGWQYNGQHTPGWTNLSSTGYSSMTKINHDCQFPFGTLSSAITSSTQQSFSVTPNVTGSVTAATVEPGMIVLLDNEEILCTASSGNTCTASQRGWAGTRAVTHAAGALYSGSVHVQYHVTFKPGDTSACTLDGTSGPNGVPSGAAVECVFIDYLIVNNVKYDFHLIYGTQTVGGVAGYSALTIPAFTYTYPVDRVFDQKQIDVASGIGSTLSPVQVGEFIDRDNVTASYGVLASQTYVVP